MAIPIQCREIEQEVLFRLDWVSREMEGKCVWGQPSSTLIVSVEGL